MIVLRQGTVLEIQRFCINDGPGIRTTVFLKGCPLRCWWCHNPDGLNVQRQMILKVNLCTGCGICASECNQKAHTFVNGKHEIDQNKCVYCGKCTEVCPAQALEIRGRQMSSEDVCKQILRDKEYYEESGGGVTFSGGEATLQPEFLEECIDLLHKQNITCYIDTCGFTSRDVFQRLIEKADGLLFDIKVVDEEKHKKYTGVSNRQIHENFALAMQKEIDIVVRIPVIPGINDTEIDREQFVEFFKRFERKVPIELLPYHSYGASKYEGLGMQYKLPEEKSPSGEDMKELEQYFANNGLCAKVR